MVDIKATPVAAVIPTLGAVRVHMLCIFFALASFLWGYDIGILGTIYVAPGFKKSLGNPTAAQTGLITAIYYLGTWLSFIFLSHRLSDRLGRKWSAFTGSLIVCVGAALQTGAHGKKGGLAMMVVGRIVAGVGTAVVSTSVPLYQSEISPAKQRGRFVVMNHIGFVAGLAVALWVGYGMTFWKHHNGAYYSWRLSVAVQFIPAIIFCAGVPFVPETPRWLMEKGYDERAEKSLCYVRGVKEPTPDVLAELSEIKANIEYHRMHSKTWKVLFTNPDLFARLWRAAFLQFLAQMSGSTAMKYYLPTNFLALGLNRRLALLASSIESTLKIGCAIMGMLLVDRVGRRYTLWIGSAVMAVALLVNGALPQRYPNNVNRAADYACIVFIFFFTFGYSIGFGPTTWVYSTEIFPTYIRAKGLGFAASGGSIGSIVVAQIWPVAFQHIGSRTYFIFMSINIASIFLVWWFYPETKGKSLEDLDALFKRSETRTSEESGSREDVDGAGEKGSGEGKEAEAAVVGVGVVHEERGTSKV